MKYIFGAYGTNNVGDEAIFEGAQVEHGELIEIYINKSNRKRSVWYADIINGRHEFHKDADELIIGGGGILYSKLNIENMIKMINLAKKNNMKISVQRIGAEALSTDYELEAKNLFDLSDSISVRSKLSQDILSKIGVSSELKKDFAYNLKNFAPTNVKLPDAKKDRLNIGLATAGVHDPTMDLLSGILRKLFPKANIFHIPHSKAYVSVENNDVICGQMLWSKFDIYHEDREDQYKLIPYYSNPNDILTIYSQLDGVIGYRYHSYIFSEITNTPLFGIASGEKAEAYFNETKRTDIMSITDVGDHKNLLMELGIFIGSINKEKK